jgi:protein-L-isoaspartate(D-aspartate) O-methyltransferase
MDRSAAYRKFFASFITASAGPHKGPVAAAFAATPREQFLGEGPWKILAGSGYIETPSADPVFLYQDVLVALTPDAPVNNGQPSLHALCLAALHIQRGETIVHVGAGTGYYTAILARLTGPTGKVFAFEIDEQLARRAEQNLREFSNVTVLARSGCNAPLPASDVIYVNAGATAPLDTWLDALLPGGRLLFPLTPDAGFGAMLLVKKDSEEHFKARFVTRAMFIACVGGRDEETARKLEAAFRTEKIEKVQSLRRHTPPDETCWFAGEGWWLSESP